MNHFSDSDYVYTVTELTRTVKATLEEAFGYVWVCGEVSNCRLHGSGHLYCTLKDEQSQLNVVFFRNDVARLRFKLEDGLQVNLRGRISVYEKRGSYQLIAATAEPVGYGALQLAFEQLKKRLAEEGLFKEEHKKPIPRFPQRIGIVTSPTGAAIRDILHVLDRRFSTVEVVLYPSLVQGEGAAEQIAAGIRTLDEEGNVDVIIVGRGGGSLEDLWAFNEEIVARAIYQCETPVVSAVGHEIDFTISDFVADLRAPTPSAAAELVVAERETVLSEIARLRESLAGLAAEYITQFEHRLELARSSYGFRRAPDLLLQCEQQVDDLHERMLELQQRRYEDLRNKAITAAKRLFTVRPDRAITAWHDRLKVAHRMLQERIRNALAFRKAAMAELAAKLDSLSPLSVLARGYSITYHLPTGRILVDSSLANAGDRVRVRLSQGFLACMVETVEDNGSG
ncbi:MAG: exodeoxyribonuclease VII large subunit [Candidatus Abyssobacteria bacterium SURF_17]|uniref:Exodeoxyribonuclease 7 large subunit n=1 Tax=Candidatus Abyssobacteria bacterium SURF_17 TaxID=2093361 RepID=A0A419F4Z8_9BACT|nr:MAG: exodeoxyribonuclease VII large subunit [Candidatus Abyssubacteria bacterium SURF_17]